MNHRFGHRDQPLTVVCGQCISCRLHYGREWAIRCYHESQMHFESSFLTLTYDEQNLPYDESLNMEHHQLFMKRLRKTLNVPVRYFMCGEYGEKTFRPHYHSTLFGYRPTDGQLISRKGGNLLYHSPSLTKIWGLGKVDFGEVTFESAAYVARYMTKKIKGDAAQEHYKFVHPDTGEVFDRKPPFTASSRRPGVGIPWIEKWWKQTYDRDTVIIRGKQMLPPSAYDRWLKDNHYELYEEIKTNRIKDELDENATEQQIYDRSHRRMYAASKIAAARLQKRESL